MEKPNKICQSCGMPLKRDPEGGGSNADGTLNTLYCSLCYRQGAFTRPDISVDEMKTLVKGKLKEFGFPGCIAGLLTWNIPKLERWSTPKS